MSPQHRFTIRTRLTLCYAAVFITTGAVLLTVVYFLARRELFAANTQMLTTLGVAASTPAQRIGPQPTDPEPALPIATVVDQAQRDTLQTIMTESALVFALMVVVSLVLCWLVARRALRPLRHITEVAERLSYDTLDSRIDHDGPADELRTLAGTFNTMLDRLGRAFQAQRLFAANASHELRTPLTIIQAAAQKALSRPSRPEPEYRSALTTIVAAAHRSERLLSSLLALAQVRQGIQSEPLDLAAIAREAIASYPDRGPAIHADLAPTPAVGDPALIELLLRNLLDNATRYNVRAGSVWIRTGRRGGRAVLEVENTGPPVAEADLPRLRQAFHRGRNRTGGPGGFGLGLAIVDAVVTAHDGRWTSVPRREGGLDVAVSLRLARCDRHAR